MSEYRTKIDEKAGRGAHFELYQFVRKSYALGASMNAGTAAAPVHIPHGEPVSVRQLRIVLTGGSALLEPGALQYAKGKLNVEVQKTIAAAFLGGQSVRQPRVNPALLRATQGKAKYGASLHPNNLSSRKWTVQKTH
jgi:uncharacterized protein (AIM24 family)